MRFKYGMPPEVDCHLENKTKIVVDYSRVHAIGTVIAIFIVFPVTYIAWRSMWSNRDIFGVFDQPPEIFLPFAFSIVILHEFIHLITHPQAGMSNESIVGMLPKRLVFYAAYQGEQSRRRLIITLMSPLVLLTIPPFLIAPWVTPSVVPFLAGLSIFNGMASTGDMMLTYKVIREVPPDAICHGEYFGFSTANDHNSSKPT